MISREMVANRKIDWDVSLRSQRYHCVGEQKTPELHSAEKGFNLLFNKTQIKRFPLDYRE